jgi:hypothetical protein
MRQTARTRRSAQQPAKPVIGLLSATSPEANADTVHALRQGLKDIGYHAVERPEPAHALRSAALLVDAARRPVAAVDGEVLAVLMDRRRPVGRMVRGISAPWPNPSSGWWRQHIRGRC